MKAAWESVHLAAIQLAGPCPVKQRLVVAFSRYLAELDSADLPRSVRPEFEALRRDMTSVAPLRGETPVIATVRKMSNEEAGRNAQRIVRLLGALSDEETATRPRNGTVVQLYGAEA
ncbi:MAG: hypothetical protein MUC71_05200 [Steroidobacteraceae bacterium]|nr:hypothetical protein [Steroidobacteraceae bacterium]